MKWVCAKWGRDERCDSGMLLDSLDARLKAQLNQRLRTEPARQREEESEGGRKAEAFYRFKAFSLYLLSIEVGTLEWQSPWLINTGNK